MARQMGIFSVNVSEGGSGRGGEVKCHIQALIGSWYEDEHKPLWSPGQEMALTGADWLES